MHQPSTYLAIIAFLTACEASTPTPQLAPSSSSSSSMPGTSSATQDVSSFPVAPAGTRGEFSKGAASEALNAASSEAKSKCKEASGPFGTAKVTTKFDPSTGKVISAVIVDDLFQGTSVGECIAKTFLQIGIPPFDGTVVSVTKAVKIQ